jgi:CRISPR/Cas system-associated protein Cas5 (RAMP superfamily)
MAQPWLVRRLLGGEGGGDRNTMKKSFFLCPHSLPVPLPSILHGVVAGASRSGPTFKAQFCCGRRVGGKGGERRAQTNELVVDIHNTYIETESETNDKFLSYVDGGYYKAFWTPFPLFHSVP